MGLAQELLDLEFPTGLRLSPSAESVVYSAKATWRTTEQGSSIWIGNTDDPWSARRLTDGSFNDNAPQWSPDGKSIVFLSDRGSGKDSSALYTSFPDGQDEPKAITPATNKKTISKFEFSPDGKHIAFLAANEKRGEDDAVDVWNENWDYAHLRLLDIESGDIRVLFSGELHVVDFSWSDDGHQIAFVTHRSPHIESEILYGATAYVIETATSGAEAREVFHIPRALSNFTWVGENVYFITFSTLADGLSSQSVYACNVLCKDDSITKIAHGVDDCAAGLCKVGDDVLVHVQRGMEDHLHLLHHGAILHVAKKCILNFDAHPRKDGEIEIVYTLGSVSRPPEVFSISPKRETVQVSTHGKAWTTNCGYCSFIECQTFDGTEELQGMFLTATEVTNKALPTIVLLHGGPYYRVTNSFSFLDHFFMPRLLHEGFAILVPNYRGSSGRGERFAQYSRGAMGTYDVSDVVAMTQYAITQNLADPSRLIVAGKSQGGFLSYLLSVRNGTHGLGWRFQAAIACAGITDWDTMTMTSDIGYDEMLMAGGAPWSLHKSDIHTRAGSAIWEFRDAAREGRIPPMLLLHGSDDVRVPVSQAHGFRRALDEAGLPFEFAVYPGEGHFFQKRKSAEDMMERIVRFVTSILS